MTIQVSPSSIPITEPARDTYLTQLLNLCQGLIQVESATVAWVQQLRDRAAALVHQSNFPTSRDEEWRLTDLSALRQLAFQKLEVQSVASLKMDIAPLTISEAANSRLTFVNGIYAPQLSSVADLPAGIVVTNLAGLPISYHQQLRNYLAQAEGKQEIFTALNTAGLTDVAVVWVAKNVVVETPIHLLSISTATDQPTLSQPRCLVIMESGSSVKLVEDYWHHEEKKKVGEAVYFTNAVTEIWIAENAQVNHTRIERDSLAAFHIGKTAVTQARDSRYTCNAINLGAKLSRHNLEIFQTGEQTETILNGLTMATRQQLVDTHSAIALNYPYGMTRQLQKCIVADRAHTVFNGKVFVAKAAQLTDAGQLNRNLLLSPKARVDTKPQLEIIADNVKCTHGATVSQVEDEEIFYLQSRGISATNARNLLVNAFAAEVINQLPVASLQATLLREFKILNNS